MIKLSKWRAIPASLQFRQGLTPAHKSASNLWKILPIEGYNGAPGKEGDSGDALLGSTSDAFQYLHQHFFLLCKVVVV